MNTLLEQAHRVTMSSVQRARDLGIRVDVKECNSRNNPELVARYNTPDRLLPDKWFHVIFHPVNQDQLNLIHTMTHELGSVGVMFDSGGCVGERDWELDWSFHLGSPEDPERHNALVELEETIKKMEITEQYLH